jgi:hypothetical protein
VVAILFRNWCQAIQFLNECVVLSKLGKASTKLQTKHSAVDFNIDC